MDFVHVDRGFGSPLVLLPGWGFLSDIFFPLLLPFDYITPVGPLTSDLPGALHGFMAISGLERISILGWSMGGYLAVDFARRYPSCVTSLILVSQRESFDPAELSGILQDVERNRPEALRAFYRRCFAGQKEHFRWFRDCLEERFIEGIGAGALLDGLSYISGFSFPSDRIPCREIALVHGSRDLVAPLDKIPFSKRIKPDVIAGTGHLPFLSPEFARLRIFRR